MQPVRGRAKKRAHLPEGFSVQEAERFVGSGGCEANAQMSNWAVLPVSQRTTRTHVMHGTDRRGESGRCLQFGEFGG